MSRKTRDNTASYEVTVPNNFSSVRPQRSANHQRQLPVVWHYNPVVKHDCVNLFFFLLINSLFLTKVLKSMISRLLLSTKEGFLGMGWGMKVSWHIRVDDYSSAILFGASSLSVQMKSCLIHLTVPVSKAQQSSMLGKIMGLFILPPHKSVALLHVCLQECLSVCFSLCSNLAVEGKLDRSLKLSRVAAR